MHKKLLFGLIAAIAATNAYSDQVLTSRAYVDNADAQKVNIAQGVGTNNANVGKTLVVNSQGNLELGTVSADNFVEDDITDGVTNKAPSENAVHDALENKQNTIATDMVDFNNGVADLPAITTYDTTGGLVANKIGILDQETIVDDEGGLSVYNTNEYGTEMDNYVPTVRAVADGLQKVYEAIRNSIPNRLNWSSSLQTPINNYSTTFSDASNTWPNYKQGYLPTVETFANALALKQNKIPARQIKIDNSDTTYSPSVVTNGTTDGSVGQMAIITGARMYDDDLAWDDYINNDSLIPTLGAVGHELDRIQANIPSVTPLTWNSTTDTAAVNNYSTTFNGTTNNWPTAQSGQYVRGAVLANALALKQNKIPASDWMDGRSNTIPGVVVSTGSDGVVEQRMILDKTQNITDESIIDLVTVGYDDLSGQSSSVAYDIHSNSVSANDVNNAVPTTTMTVAIANAAANTKQNKMTCTRWLDTPENPDHTDENCLLWELGN